MEVNFNTLDWVIIGVILLSMTLSLFYGFVKECLSLIKWFASFTVAKLFYESLAKSDMMSSLPENVLSTILIEVLIRIMRKTSGSINLTDRILGLFFGALRGVMVVCLGYAICKMAFTLGLFTFVQKMPIWADSYLIPECDKIVVWFFDKIDFTGVVNGITEQLSSPAGQSAADPSQLINPSDVQNQPLTEQEQEMIRSVTESEPQKVE